MTALTFRLTLQGIELTDEQLDALHEAGQHGPPTQPPHPGAGDADPWWDGDVQRVGPLPPS